MSLRAPAVRHAGLIHVVEPVHVDQRSRDLVLQPHGQSRPLSKVRLLHGLDPDVIHVQVLGEILADIPLDILAESFKVSHLRPPLHEKSRAIIGTAISKYTLIK